MLYIKVSKDAKKASHRAVQTTHLKEMTGRTANTAIQQATESQRAMGSWGYQETKKDYWDGDTGFTVEYFFTLCE